MREGRFAARMRKILRGRGAIIMPIVAGEFNGLGWPDCWVGHALWEGFIEWKGRATEVKEIQWHRIKTLRARYCCAWVCRFVDADHVSIQLPEWGDWAFRVVEATGLLDVLAKLEPKTLRRPYLGPEKLKR